MSALLSAIEALLPDGGWKCGESATSIADFIGSNNLALGGGDDNATQAAGFLNGATGANESLSLDASTEFLGTTYSLNLGTTGRSFLIFWMVGGDGNILTNGNFGSTGCSIYSDGTSGFYAQDQSGNQLGDLFAVPTGGVGAIFLQVSSAGGGTVFSCIPGGTAVQTATIANGTYTDASGGNFVIGGDGQDDDTSGSVQYVFTFPNSGTTLSAFQNICNLAALAATQLGFTASPGSMVLNAGTLGAGSPPVVTVATETSSGLLVGGGPYAGAAITIAIASGPGGAALSGTTTVNAVNGVARFSNLSVNRAGTYSLSATASGLTAAVCGSFSISVNLAFVSAPTTAQSGVAMSALKVQAQDANGDVYSAYSSPITVAKSSGPGSLSGTLCVAAVSGVATFANVAPSALGMITITASGALVNAAGSAAIGVIPYAPSGNLIPIHHDDDFLDDFDGGLAAGMLNHQADLGNVSISSWSVSSTASYAAGVGSSIYTYYGRGSIPFGQNKGAAEETGGTPFAQTLTSGFPNVVRSGGAIGSAVTTLRQTLFDAVQLGYKVTIVSTGGLTNVAGLLSSTGDGITSLTGLELISGACKELIVMGGGYPSSVGNPSAGYEFNFNLDAASTYAVCNPGTTVWPLSTVPQYFVGFEWGSSTGHAIVAGNNLSQTSSYSPLRKGVEMSRISVFGGAAFAVWDPVAMAFALVGTSTGLFATVQGANTITASNGANSFVAGAGNQYYVTLGTGATNAQVMAFIEENIMAPPVNPWQSTALEYLELEIPFDEGTGATANDLSGNANTATLHNAAWASPGMMGVSTMLDLSKNSAAYAQTANAIPTTAAQSWSKHIKVTLPSTFAANALIWGNSRSTYPYEAIYLNRVSSTTCQIQFIGALSSGSSVTITAPAQSGVYYSPGQVLDIFPVQINDTRFLYIGVNGGPPTLVGTAGPNQNDVVSTTSGINANGTGPNTFGGWLNGATVEDQFAGQIQDAKFFLGYALSLAEAGDLAKGSLSSLPPGVTDVEAGVEYAASGETETGILAVGGGVPVGVGSGMHGGFEN